MAQTKQDKEKLLKGTILNLITTKQNTFLPNILGVPDD